LVREALSDCLNERVNENSISTHHLGGQAQLA
jgi:hypothetical protein